MIGDGQAPRTDWPRVFGVAAELDKAVQIDAYPDRQDLSIDLIKIAKKAGCRISIGTDAVHLFDAHRLSSEDLAEIDFPPTQTDTRAACDHDGFVVEGIVDIRQPSYEPGED